MSTTTASRSVHLGIYGKSLLLIFALLAAFFIFDNAFRYFNWSEEAYGSYYWKFRVPLIIHISGGVIALLCGVFQLWSGLGKTQMRVHPLVGRGYVAGIVLGSAGAIQLSLTTGTYGLTFGVALFWLAIVWLLTTFLAILCIRKKKVILHQQWMTRSYILTFAFVIFRIVTDYVPYESWWGLSRQTISNATIWAVWVIPFIGYEVWLLIRQIMPGKSAI